MDSRGGHCLGCDLLLHIGHSDLGVKTEVPVMYYEYPVEIDPVPVLKKNMDKLKAFRRIGLATTVQHLESLPKARKFLEKEGKEALIKGNGQVLGCRHENLPKEADCILFIGSGRFHPLGILKATEKPVMFLDIENMSLQDLTHEREKERIKSMLRVEKVRSLKRFGILVSTKKGQLHLEEALKTKERLERKGKKAFLLAADEFTPDKLLGLDIEVLVDMACPRLADDSGLFKKPILTRKEAESL